MANTFSIHPRNWPSGSGKLLNTASKATGKARDRAIAGITKHLEKHPTDDHSKRYLARLKSEQ